MQFENNVISCLYAAKNIYITTLYLFNLVKLLTIQQCFLLSDI